MFDFAPTGFLLSVDCAVNDDAASNNKSATAKPAAKRIVLRFSETEGTVPGMTSLDRHLFDRNRMNSFISRSPRFPTREQLQRVGALALHPHSFAIGALAQSYQGLRSLRILRQP